jgi:hypothetical protein
MRNTPEYQAWQAMKLRCCDPGNKDYEHWGGRGITVCNSWMDSFEAFYKDVGPKPSNTCLDRIDNNKGYFPENVRWATYKEQAENRRGSWTVHINDQEYPSLEEAGRAHGVSATTIVRWCNSVTRPYCIRNRTYS